MPEKSLKLWHMGTHLRVLNESYPMSTKMTGFRWFSKIFASLCFGRLEGLYSIEKSYDSPLDISPCQANGYLNIITVRLPGGAYHLAS